MLSWRDMADILLLIAGLALLPWGASWLTRGTMAVARRYQIHAGLATLVLVAFGTSLPELSVNVVASFTGQSPIIVGNIFGSVIANVLLVLGLITVAYPCVIAPADMRRMNREAIAATGLTLLAFGIGVGIPAFLGDAAFFARWHGAFLLVSFAGFMAYSFYQDRQTPTITAPTETTRIPSSVAIVAGLGLLLLGGRLVVNGVLGIGQLFGVSNGFVAATLVAVGTSLPELATALALMRQDRASLALTDIVGSNIFNVGCILSLSIIFTPFSIGLPEIRLMLLSCLAVAVLGGILSTGKGISRPMGMALLLSYGIVTLSMDRAIA